RDLPSLVRVVGPELTERAMATASAQRSAAGAIARFGPRLLVIADEHGEVAGTLPQVDESLTPEALGVTVVHLLADRLHEPSDVKIRLTVDESGQVEVEDLRDPDLDGRLGGRTTEPVRAAVDDVAPALLTGVCRALMPLRLSITDSADAASQAAIG